MSDKEFKITAAVIVMVVWPTVFYFTPGNSLVRISFANIAVAIVFLAWSVWNLLQVWRHR